MTTKPGFWAALALAGATAGMVACGGGGSSDGDDGDGDTPGPYDAIPASRTLDVPSLGARVDIVRDAQGIAHIYAANEADAAFANGYVVAHDRLLQLDLLRHVAKGRIAELFGSLAPEQIDNDLYARMHQFAQRAEAQYQQMKSSTDAKDQAMATYLERFADGVNHYRDEVRADVTILDSAVAVFVNPSTVADWTPSDSLAIGLLQAWALSHEESDLRFTAALQSATAVFDQADQMAEPERARRAGAFYDLFAIEPVDQEHAATIDGWPNVGSDSGSRAKPEQRPAGPGAPDQIARPYVDPALIANARRAARPRQIFGMRFDDPRDGSNNWIVGPSEAGGKTLLANDPHLQLSSPPIFHAIHITVPGQIDIGGASLAGVPGIVLGYNANIAWGSTTANHDVTDYYLETIVPCAAGGGDCVVGPEGEVKIETWTEEVKVGALGTITDTFTATYEYVPHHGPILPTVGANHRLVPRTGDQAISVQFTGHRTTRELRALYNLQRASTVAEAFAALDDFDHGAQSWVVIDNQGHFGWTTTALVPDREPSCYTWHATMNPEGLAPFFVAPGDGGCEWTGTFMDPRYIPHAVDPAKGWLHTANGDLTGETFDGDALNGPMVNGRPLYVIYPGNPGFRAGRIGRRLAALAAEGDPITRDDLASVQADTHSNLGALFTPPLLAALDDALEEIATPGTHPGIAAYVAGLSMVGKTRLMVARMRLGAWTFETPPAVEGTPTAAEIGDSVATSIYNAWQVSFLARAFGDELGLLGEGPNEDFTVTAMYRVLLAPGELETGLHPTTGQAVLCDDLTTAGEVESCTLIALKAVDAAMTRLESDLGADVDGWRWGKLHTLTLSSLVPDDELNVPPPSDATFPGGFPRAGDVHSVDASSPGVGNFDFSYGHGPSIRHLVEFEPGGTPRVRFALPGGQIMNRASGHFRDLIDEYWRKNLYFDVPWTTAEILSAGEDRWRLQP